MNGTLLRRTVLHRLVRHRKRSLLTGLGIALGVLATVLLQSVSGTVRSKFLDFLETAYPADGIVVYAGGGPMSGGGPRRLSIEDAEAIVAATGAASWDPLAYGGPRDVRAEGTVLRIPVMGLSERGARVRRRGAARGDYLTASDVRSRSTVALVGATTASELFGDQDPIGRQVFVDGIAFDVRGVLERRGSDPHGGDQDFVIVVPYTTLLDRVLHTTSIAAVTFRLDDPGRVEATRAEIVDLLRREHGIGEGQADDFTVVDSARMQALFGRSFRTFELFVPLIAGTVFVVAALIVLGVSLLGIRARRDEIGLRKAVGARPGDVETQIVGETLAIAGVAAFTGIALAPLGLLLLGPLLAAKFGVTGVAISWRSASVAIAAAMLTGLLGAVLPARRAARLDAAEALR